MPGPFPMLAAAFVLSGWTGATAADESGHASRRIVDDAEHGHRIIHVFDFDESEAGNLEEIPKFWEPLQMPGFPHYAKGVFDSAVGHDAPPSFHLVSEGRSVAFVYRGPDTRVRANTDYRIVGYVRPDHLRHARACLAAVYLNEDGEPLYDTLVRTAYLPDMEGTRAANDWTRVALTLPSAPRDAFSVGLVAWVLQEDVWRPVEPDPNHLPLRDINGGAWFDDLSVYAMPRVELSTSARSNVLQQGNSQELQVLVADEVQSGLENELTITNADGALVERRSIETTFESGSRPQGLPMDFLPPGIYHARLDVRSQGRSIITRDLRFACLSESLSSPGGARAFGIAIDPAQRADADTELDLLREQGARSVKLPVWSGVTDPSAKTTSGNGSNRLVHTLEREGFALTGVLYDSRSAGATLYELLGSPTSIWQDHLAAQAAPIAGSFRDWQLGSDGPAPRASRQQILKSLTHLRRFMREFLTVPRLVLPISAGVELPTEPWPVEQLSINLGTTLSSDLLKKLVTEAGREEKLMQAFVPPIAPVRFQRAPRLADWARRLILARHAGSQGVIVPQTWTVRETPHGSIAEPLEEFVILHTVVSAVGEAAPGPELTLGGTARCVSFVRGDEAVLAVWDPAAPASGRDQQIQISGADQVIDLWGRARPLSVADDGQAVVRLYASPLFVLNAERSAVEFYAGVGLDRRRFEAGAARQPATLTIQNSDAVGRAGSVRLIPPDDWEITPGRFEFNCPPRLAFTQELSIDIPHNVLSGDHELHAEIALNDGRRFDVVIPVAANLEGIDVRGMAYLKGNVLQVRHAVSNRTAETLHFRGSALLPGKERQYRPITSLMPGETQTVVYRFDDAANLAGTSVRLELREINDGRRTHAMDVPIP
ncbi:MAG: hypothetical protein J5J06_00525 [Phycisphaerae bacterium]|nr:hypothetical protein [Phycisphaerae bacterium]